MLVSLKGNPGKLLVMLVLLLWYLCPSMSIAAPVLVAKKNFPLDAIQAQELADLWLGKKRSINGLGRVRMVDLEPDNPLYQQFYENMIGISGKRLEIYWSKRVFSGKSSRPKRVRSSDEVIRFVTNVPGVIGYIDSSEVSNKLKVLKVISTPSNR